MQPLASELGVKPLEEMWRPRALRSIDATHSSREWTPMALYELGSEKLLSITESTFIDLGVREEDLQRLLREQVEVISQGSLVSGEEFNDWDDSSRRIDLLALDPDGSASHLGDVPASTLHLRREGVS